MPAGDSGIQAKVGEQVKALVDDNSVAAALHTRAVLLWQHLRSAKRSRRTYRAATPRHAGTPRQQLLGKEACTASMMWRLSRRSMPATAGVA